MKAETIVEVPQSSLSQLEQDAAREQTVVAASPINVPLPPGVEPEALALRSESDERARLTEAQVMRLLAAKAPAYPPLEQPTQPANPEEALRHYVKGRSAAQESRLYVAITELQQARDLDPTSPRILHELARCYIAIGNPSKSVSAFEDLLRFDPDNSEAQFTIAWAAATRRDFEQAAAIFAARRLAGKSFEHDPAADLIADAELARCLRALGYDRAFIEVSRKSLDLPDTFLEQTDYLARLKTIYRMRGESWRSVGDAHCRLGQFSDALSAYRSATDYGFSDPGSLHPRVIYAHLSAGNPKSAQYELLNVIRSRDQSVSDREIQLCSYIAANAPDTGLLGRALAEMYEAHAEDAGFARAAAAMLPESEAENLLLDFMRRRPADLHVFSELLAAQAARQPDKAVRFTVSLLEAEPTLASKYVLHLVKAIPEPLEALAVARQLPDGPRSSELESRLLAVLGGLGEAWTVAEQARTQWPADEAIALWQIELAAMLQEPALLQAAIESADQFDDAWSWVVRCDGLRAAGRDDEAVVAAQHAVDVAGDDRTAMLALAEALAAQSGASQDEQMQRETAMASVRVAERVIERHPGDETAYTILLSLYGPVGPLMDINMSRQLVRQLLEHTPDSRLQARLAAEEEIARGSYEPALERLLNLYENDPTDVSALRMAIFAWGKQQRLEAAERWLRAQRAQHPGDPDLIEQWANVHILMGTPESIVDDLESLVRSNSEQFAAKQALELVYLAMDEPQMAASLGFERLTARPRGLRRELDMAALSVRSGKHDDAIERLQWIAEQANEHSTDLLLKSLAVADNLPADHPQRAMITLTLASAVADLVPDPPIQVFALAMRSRAALGQLDSQFDSLVTGLAEATGELNDRSRAEPGLWAGLAQALIDEGYEGAAGRMLDVRIRIEQIIDRDFVGRLCLAKFACDAAAGAAEQTLELLRFLDERGELRVIAADGASPSLAETLYEVSTTFTLVGDDAGSDLLLSEALRLDPSRVMAKNNLGYSRIERGIADPQTVNLIEDAYEAMPDEENVLDTIGWLRYRQGRFQGSDADPGALQMLQQSVQSGMQISAEVQDHLGDTLWRVGDHEGAAAAWEQAADVLSDSLLRDQYIQYFTEVQRRLWLVVVRDPQDMYHEQFGQVLERVRAKLDAVANNEPPPVALTFAEADEAVAGE